MHLASAWCGALDFEGFFLFLPAQNKPCETVGLGHGSFYSCWLEVCGRSLGHALGNPGPGCFVSSLFNSKGWASWLPFQTRFHKKVHLDSKVACFCNYQAGAGGGGGGRGRGRRQGGIHSRCVCMPRNTSQPPRLIRVCRIREISYTLCYIPFVFAIWTTFCGI